MLCVNMNSMIPEINQIMEKSKRRKDADNLYLLFL